MRSNCRFLLGLRTQLIKSAVLPRSPPAVLPQCILHKLAPVTTTAQMRQISILSSTSLTGVLHGDTERREKYLQPTSLTWSAIRTYAKKKGKGGKSSKGGKISLSSEQLDGLFNKDKCQTEYDRELEELKTKFIHTLSVRTSQGVFDNLNVKTEDGNFPLIQIGQVLQKNPQLVTINLAMSPQYINDVKEALVNSGLNVNPQQDGTSIFIQIPRVTTEHRASLAKNAKTLADTTKKNLRGIYSKYSKKIKNAKEGHSADLVRAADSLAKDMMDQTVAQIDEMTAAKQKELKGGK